MTNPLHPLEQASVRRFEAFALNPAGEQGFGFGKASALALGYPANLLDQLPARVVETFAGVANPWQRESPQPGESVLDAGCGSGTDLLLARHWVGDTGSVTGVDAAPAMLQRIRQACPTCDLIQATLNHIPLPDQSFHRIVSNGVLNLCVDKAAVLAEWFRLLKPGGTLHLADMLNDSNQAPDLPPSPESLEASWSA